MKTTATFRTRDGLSALDTVPLDDKGNPFPMLARPVRNIKLPAVMTATEVLKQGFDDMYRRYILVQELVPYWKTEFLIYEELP